jgi:hypothetical protein
MYGDVGTAMMLSNGGAGTPEAEALISDVRLALSEFTPTLSQVKHAAKGAHADLSTFASGFARIWNDPLYGGGLAGILGRMGALLPADAAKKPGGNDKPLEIKMPITVVSQDPDRFAVALNKAARRLATNPRAARRALREGV